MGNFKTKALTLCLLYTFHSTIAQNETELKGPPKLLLISFDGFRWDYLDKVKAVGGSTPNFDAIISTGVKAEYMKNSFTTDTFPNHYTIVTGLYEESHGVVSNQMFDARFNETFKLEEADSPATRLDKWFNNGTSGSKVIPIWTLNQLQSSDITRQSGVVMWPGSTALIHKIQPKYLMNYNESITNETRIDTIIEWFTQTHKPINFGALYFSEPDELGHQVGPDHPALFNLIQALDKLVGYLIKQLQEHGLWDKLNVIITSDHGMANINEVVQLDEHVDASLFSVHGASPALGILPKPGQEEAVYKALQNVPNTYCYWKKDIPREYYYTYNVRIQPILLLAKQGTILCVNSTACDYYKESKGDHGYNNSLPDMHPFFMARGPALKQGVVSKPFNNVDLYSLMCRILGLKPGWHQGNLENVLHMLEDDETEAEADAAVWVVAGVGACAACVSAIFCLAAARSTSRYKYRKHIPSITGRDFVVGTDSPMSYVSLLNAEMDEDDEIA